MGESIGFDVFKPHIKVQTGEMTLWLDKSLDKGNIAIAVKELLAFEKHLLEDMKVD